MSYGKLRAAGLAIVPTKTSQVQIPDSQPPILSVADGRDLKGSCLGRDHRQAGHVRWRGSGSDRSTDTKLRNLLRANQRLSAADLLKDFFGQFWSYEHVGWTRRIFR